MLFPAERHLGERIYPPKLNPLVNKLLPHHPPKGVPNSNLPPQKGNRCGRTLRSRYIEAGKDLVYPGRTPKWNYADIRYVKRYY
jgi:hypothetical protein